MQLPCVVLYMSRPAEIDAAADDDPAPIFGRAIVHWDLRESMTEAEIEIILQGGKEKHPEAKPRVISDNGPQFIARDFKEFIRFRVWTHVRPSPYYPQLAQIAERRMHPAGHAAAAGRCATADPGIRGPLQQGAPAQRHWLHHGHRTCWQGARRRFMRHEIASWKRRVSSGNSAARRQREKTSYNDLAK